MFAVPVTAETTVGEIRQKVQEWKPEYSLEQIELVCKDKDAWGPLFNKTSRPRDDDETVESLWSDWDIPRRMMQVALWIKEKNEETGVGVHFLEDARRIQVRCYDLGYFPEPWILEELRSWTLEDMDCGSIQSSVVDWPELQQLAVKFNGAWALVCNSDCGATNTQEVNIAETLWQRALKASSRRGFGEVPSSEGSPWLLGTSAWPVAGLLAKWSLNCTRRSSLQQQVRGTRCSVSSLNEFNAALHVAGDKTLALLLPGSGGAALIFDGRIDYFAMAAIPAVWQLYKAFPQVRSFGRGSSRSPPTCAAEVATKEVLLLFLRLLGPTTPPDKDPLHPSRMSSLAKTLAAAGLQRMFQTAWPALAMLAATGLTTWRSHGLYPAAQVQVSDVTAVVSAAADLSQSSGAPDILEAVAAQRSLQRSLWQKTSSFGSITPEVSQIWRQIASWLLEAPEDIPQVVFMTMFFGNLGNNTWVSRFLDRALVVGLPRLIFASPDPDYLHDCTQVSRIWQNRGDAYQRLLCFRSFSKVVRPYDVNNYAKFVLLPLLLSLGVSYAWLDIDIFIAQNPTARLLQLAETADVLTTDHFDESCLNHGVIFVKASDRTLRWVLSYIRWMHVYPFGHDQNGWDAFLGHSIQFEPFVPTGHDISLRVLDTGKEFLTLTGWAGDDADLPAALLLHLTRTTPIGVREKRTQFFELLDATLPSLGSSVEEHRRDLKVLQRALSTLRVEQPSPKRSCYEGVHVAVEQAVHDGSYWHLFD
ncbi:unnamed protein product [Symbiodinium pilosum]|uniref:Nucleotide-diphospho-sugar transferase domain-containing protein n=1 Tax=Symbiodinium pilosum TaxID=2952 RepID=A0A812Y665_SYMPI|nr:unnamed protein product [Symbiodinium pilosum]